MCLALIALHQASLTERTGSLWQRHTVRLRPEGEAAHSTQCYQLGAGALVVEKTRNLHAKRANTLGPNP